MKKFLFTLATVCAFGLTNAQTQHEVVLSMPEQIEMGADTDNRIDVKVQLTALSDAVAGVQLYFVMEDPEGNPINTGTSGSIYLNGSTWATGLEGCVTGSSWACQKKADEGTYVALAVNTTYNYLWATDPIIFQDPEDPDADPEEIWPGCELPVNVFQFTVRTRAANWPNVEYAVLRLDSEVSPISWYNGDKTYNAQCNEMKIVNKDYITTKAINGTVTLGDLDGYNVPVTINMVDPTEGYVTTVTVNGETATIENGVIVLGEDPAYGTYDVKVVITADGYEGTVEAERSYTIAQQTSADPIVTVEEEATYITITAKGNGTVTLNVPGYETYTDEDGSLYVVVPRPEAENGTTVEYTATNTEAGKLTATVTGEATAAPQAKAASQAPTFRMETFDEYVLIYAEGNGTVTMTDANGNVIDNPVRVERPAYGQEAGSYTAYATNLEDGWYTATADSKTFEIPAQAEKVYQTPAPTVTYDENTYTITATGEGTVMIYIQGHEGPVAEGVGTATYTFTQTEEDQYVGYWATANAGSKEGYDSVLTGMSQTATAFVPAKEVVLPELQGTVTVSVDAEGNVTAVYNGDEQGVTVTVDPSKLNEYGTYTVNYTATADGYQPKTGTATVVYSAPVLEQADAPSSNKANYVYKDPANGVYYNAYTVTLSQPETSDDEEYVIYYRVGTLVDGEYVYPENYTEYVAPFNVAHEGTYMVEAYAVAKNKEKSNYTYDGFTVSVATSIEELFAGENVASVRYFNVAGQEMQEVNGLTIVVTTYTDGTQSAVKVMK